MATAIQTLQTEWETAIALISDALIKAEATYTLSRYIAALTNQAALEANEISSYSVMDRSVTRRNAGEGTRMIAQLRADLWRACYGGVSLLDMNMESAQPA